MGRSQETSSKKEIKKKQDKKKKDKEQKRVKRKLEGKKGFDDMIAYVDQYGMITSTPPDSREVKNTIAAEDIQLGARSNSHNSPGDLVKNGVVSFFNERKGFGFIRENESGTSYFFHIKNLVDEVVQGNRVSFETGRGPKGVTALNIRISGE
jgi:cold shock CspA family protein